MLSEMQPNPSQSAVGLLPKILLTTIAGFVIKVTAVVTLLRDESYRLPESHRHRRSHLIEVMAQSLVLPRCPENYSANPRKLFAPFRTRLVEKQTNVSNKYKKP